MRFKINDVIYDPKAITTLSLRHIMSFNSFCERYQPEWSWSRVESVQKELEGLSSEERKTHPATIMLLTLSMWASMTASNKLVTFEDVVDMPIDSLEFLPDPQDHRQPDHPQKASSVSGAAGSRRGASNRASKRTSKKASTKG